MSSAQNAPSGFVPAEPLVLLVEDDFDSREMYTAGLEWAGFRVTSAGDGTTALAQAVSLEPHIVVTDLHVPGLNGLELCRRLKMTERTATIPVIAVTGAARANDVELARAAGFDRVLIKPCLPDELRDTIQALLARSARARRASAQAAERSSELRTRSTSLALQSRVIQCRTAAIAGQPMSLPCPDCASPLTWHDTQTVAGIQFDYFTPCEKGCGQYYFDHQRRRFMRLR
jgi:DNA-binding response OmpR family regulator